MRFNYRNFKELEPVVEERDGYGGVQAWGLEYYKQSMVELEELLQERIDDLKRYKELRMPGVSYSIVTAQIQLLRNILGENS